MKVYFIIFISILSLVFFTRKNKNLKIEKITYNSELGIGPFKNFENKKVLDSTFILKGKQIFISKCINCHDLGVKNRIGPGLKNITNKRNPIWILNFFLNTTQMLKLDKSLLKLRKIYNFDMTNQHLSKNEALFLLEFLRFNDGNVKIE